MTDHGAHPSEFLAELALGVLPSPDATEIRAHLEACEQCTAEFDEMARVVAVLPLATEEIEPSPAVKQGLMARIANETHDDRNPARRRAWPWVAAAAASIALIAGIVGGVYAVNDDSPRSGSADNAYAEFARAVAKGTVERAVVETDDGSLSLVMAPGATVAYIWVEGLAPLEDGMAYQVWASADGRETMVPLQQFAIEEGGLWISDEQPIDSYTWVGLTVEEEGDVSAPGQEPFMVVDLASAFAAAPGAIR